MNTVKTFSSLCATLASGLYCLADAEISGRVFDQYENPVANIKIYDVLNSGLSAVSGPDGRYTISGATNTLNGVLLVAYADYTCDSSIYGAPDWPLVYRDATKADIVVVRKPAVRGNVKIIFPWVIEHGAENNIAHSNLVAEVENTGAPSIKSLHSSASAGGISVTNIVFGKEYIIAVDAPPIDFEVLSAVRGVFYDGDIGVTNAFRLLSGSTIQVGLTNMLYVIESKQNNEGNP